MSRPRRPSAARLCAVALASLLAAGCGSGTATVSGTVTLRGKPVSGGSVVFYCADQQIVRGLIGPDGTYSIPNVPCGPAVVTVQAHPRVPPGLYLRQNLPPASGGPLTPTVDHPPEAHGTPIPARYGLPEESGLSAVVERGRTTHDIDLKP